MLEVFLDNVLDRRQTDKRPFLRHGYSTANRPFFNGTYKRPKLRPRDRIFWVLLSRLWSNWRSALAIVQPETVIRWHRMGFKLYWWWKSRAGKPDRPCIEREIRNLILPCVKPC